MSSSLGPLPEGAALSSNPAGGPPSSSVPAEPPALRPPPRPWPLRSPPERNTTWLATTSVVYCLAPSLLVHSRVCSRPSRYTCRPLVRYSPQSSACFPHTTMRCHSVRSCFCPDLSVQFSLVAMLKLATA